MTKAEIRKTVKQELAKNKSKLQEESKIICNKILSSKEYKEASIILAYMALPDEVDLFPVIKQALAQEKTVYLPHVYPDTSKMEFFKFSTDTPVITGEFGIKEPAFSDETPAFNYTPGTPVLFLIPGRGFTKDGNRIGRGKGFYDYYLEPLKNYSEIKKAGICFPLQVLQEIPTAPHDIKMDLLFY